MDLDRFGVVQVLESHDGLDEEGLGIIEVEMEEGPEKGGKTCGTTKVSWVFPYIMANPVYTPLTPFDTSPRS